MGFQAHAGGPLAATTSLALVAACGWLGLPGHTTTYYAPALRPDGEEIAYLKREARFRTRGGFGLGQELTFTEDRLRFCRAPRDLGRERCLEEWLLPLAKASPSAKGDIVAELAWDGGDARYRIRLVRFGPTDVGMPGPNRGEGPERVLTNMPPDRPPAAPPVPARWRVRVDRDAGGVAFPIDNRIVVEPIEAIQ